MPATASTKRAVSVAMPERWPRKLSAVRSAASSAAAGPLGEQDLGGHVLAPLALDDEVVDVLHPALAHRLRDRIEPKDDAGLLSARSAPAPARPPGTVASEVTSPGRDPRPARAPRSRSATRQVGIAPA